MVVVQHDNPVAFAERVMPFLLERECENCNLIGMIGAIARNELAPTRHPLRLLFTIEQSGALEGVVAQTMHRAMLVSKMSVSAANALAESLRDLNWEGDGVNGPVQTADVLAAKLCDLTVRSMRLRTCLRVFELRALSSPRPASGSFVVASHQHAQLLQDWRSDFATEIGEPGRDPIEFIQKMIDDRRLFLWCDPEPRCMTGIAGPTPSGIRINSVYTPPEFRGRGYASNLVAAVSQDQLNRGRTFCFLFTDLSNPTSNKIYQQLGYRAVTDFHDWEIGKSF